MYWVSGRINMMLKSSFRRSLQDFCNFRFNCKWTILLILSVFVTFNYFSDTQCFYSAICFGAVIFLFTLGSKHLTFKGTNGRQKTYEIFHVYCIFYSGFMCQTTVIFGIMKDGSLESNILASWNCFTCRNLFQNGAFCKKAQNFV